MSPDIEDFLFDGAEIEKPEDLESRLEGRKILDVLYSAKTDCYVVLVLLEDPQEDSSIELPELIEPYTRPKQPKQHIHYYQETANNPARSAHSSLPSPPRRSEHPHHSKKNPLKKLFPHHIRKIRVI
jgi:hypothetical protein